jgi:hypothetical protein|tara:strand:- start:155 stop:469 length:315 start_codon:yes stop_codon:yes gene_type:complete
MGTWHVDKNRLKKILTKPIENRDSIDKLGNGLGDDELYDFLGEMQDKYAPNKIVNEAVLDFLTTPDHKNEVWLTAKDIEEVVSKCHQHFLLYTSPSLLEKITTE